MESRKYGAKRTYGKKSEYDTNLSPVINAALALAFVPPSWLEELTEEAYRKAMQIARE